MDSLTDGLPDARTAEIFETILSRPGTRIERIVSHGQVTPPDAPWVQPHDEWVLLLAGAASIRIGDEADRLLAPGDHMLLPAGRPHWVTMTAIDRPTVWLAVHFT